MGDRKILVVDDDKSLVNSFKMILQSEGYFVEAALTGKDALNRAKKNSFDLAIVDIKLPDVMGDEVARKLKKQDEKIEIILITGYPFFQDCIDSLEIGVNEILLKPISADELIRVTKEAFYAYA